MQSVRPEEKTDKGQSPAECPISLIVMQDPVLTQCGHLFDSMNVKVGDDCALCRSKIETLTRNNGVNDLVIHITGQEKEIAALKAQLAEQQKQLETQQKTIKLLTPDESKSRGEVPIDLRIAFAEEPDIAQKIADAESLQKETCGEKIALSYLARKRFLDSGKKHAQIKAEKTNHQSEHIKKQSEIKSSLQQLVNQLNPSESILDEKKDHSPQIFEALSTKAREGQQDKEKFLENIRQLQLKYEKNIYPELTDGVHMFYKWSLACKKLQQQKQELQVLRQSQLNAHQATSNIILQQRDNTSSLFGGTKEFPKKSQEQKRMNVELPNAEIKDIADLWTAVRSSNSNTVAKLLETKSFNLEQRDKDKHTFLSTAITKQDTKTMELLIHYKANVNAMVPTATRRIPLLVWAMWVERGSLEKINEMLVILLKNNARVDLEDEKGETPLHWAARFYIKLFIKTLQEYGAASHHTKSSFNHTPLEIVHYRSTIKPAVNEQLKKEVEELLIIGAESAAKRKRAPSAPPAAPLSVASSSYNHEASPPPLAALPAAPNRGR